MYLHNLEDDVSDPRLWELVLPLSHESQQISPHVLKDEIEARVLPDDLPQFHHVRVVKLLQALHLRGRVFFVRIYCS